MSMLGRLKKKVHYETDIPRCGSCTHFRPPHLFLRDSLPRMSPILCAKHSFYIQPNAVCDCWAGKDGSTLTGSATPKHSTE